MDSVADGNGNTYYFWADNRPNGGGFHSHLFSIAAAGDYGYQATFQIWRTSSTHFTAAIYTQTNSYYGYSTGQSYVPNYIDVGSELSGSGTVYPEASQAPNVDFVGNLYEPTGSGIYYYQDWHNYHSGSGSLYSGYAPPPFYSVVSVPDGSANSGGDFQTWCC